MTTLKPHGAVQEISEGCHLISENYAYALQLLLGFSALAGLVIKRWRAPVKRDLVVWMYDVSKQGFGAMFIHVCNIFLSIQEASERKSDECAMYFINFFLDIAIGTFVIWCFVRVQELAARRFGINSLKVTGDYGTPPLFSVYRTQLLVYMLILVICKAVTTTIVITMDDVLSSLANALFRPVRGYPELELTIVMIICPWMLNALQFWVLDNVLMSERSLPDVRGGSLAKCDAPLSEDDFIPIANYGSVYRYEHMTSYSGPAGGGGEGGGAGRDATERDGLNTPPRLPDEPAWMAQHPSAGDGEDGAG
ncbi:unnamed protein product, partial [Ascophyllum nodosum]